MNEFNREQSLIMDEQENMKERIQALENEVAILKQNRVQADILLEVVKLRERVEVLESSAHQ